MKPNHTEKGVFVGCCLPNKWLCTVHNHFAITTEKVALFQFTFFIPVMSSIW